MTVAGSAHVHLPVRAGGRIFESGCAVAEAEGVSLLQESGQDVVLKVASGEYDFEVRYGLC